MALTQVEEDVQAASDRFYDALTEMANGNADPMVSLWPRRDDVTTMHPVGGREVGWEEVSGSWRAVADVAEGGRVEPTDRLVRVTGDLAYELVTENASMALGGESVEGSYRATNVYRREDGEWRIVHHHSDLDEAFVDLLRRLTGE